ncbi:MAG TPA: glycosyltransferase 87 family protein [Bacteroidota bacterium]
MALLMAVHTAVFALLALLVLAYRGTPADAGAPEDARLLWIILGFGLLFRLTLVPHPAVASDDIYRYLWDGKVLSHGVNPYAYPPADPHLAPLASGELPALVNHPELGSIYPPLAQSFFWLSWTLFGPSQAGLKLLLTLADAATLLLLVALLRRIRKPSLFVILYAWSPLPVLYGSLDGHIDLLGTPLLLLALLWGLKSRAFRAALGVAGAALVKIHPLLIAPLLVKVRRNAAGMAAALLAVALFILAWLPFRDHLPEITRWLSVYGSRWEFNGGLFTVAYWVLGTNESAHSAMNFLLLLWIIWLIIRHTDWLESVFQAFLGLVVFGPVVHPWYLLWLSALIVVRWSRAVFVFLGLSVVSNVVVWRYQSGSGWNDDPLLLLIQYVPLFMLLAVEIAAARPRRSIA